MSKKFFSKLNKVRKNFKTFSEVLEDVKADVDEIKDLVEQSDDVIFADKIDTKLRNLEDSIAEAENTIKDATVESSELADSGEATFSKKVLRKSSLLTKVFSAVEEQWRELSEAAEAALEVVDEPTTVIEAFTDAEPEESTIAKSSVEDATTVKEKFTDAKVTGSETGKVEDLTAMNVKKAFSVVKFKRAKAKQIVKLFSDIEENSVFTNEALEDLDDQANAEVTMSEKAKQEVCPECKEAECKCQKNDPEALKGQIKDLCKMLCDLDPAKVGDKVLGFAKCLAKNYSEKDYDSAEAIKDAIKELKDLVESLNEESDKDEDKAQEEVKEETKVETTEVVNEFSDLEAKNAEADKVIAQFEADAEAKATPISFSFAKKLIDRAKSIEVKTFSDLDQKTSYIEGAVDSLELVNPSASPKTIEEFKEEIRAMSEKCEELEGKADEKIANFSKKVRNFGEIEDEASAKVALDKLAELTSMLSEAIEDESELAKATETPATDAENAEVDAETTATDSEDSEEAPAIDKTEETETETTEMTEDEESKDEDESTEKTEDDEEGVRLEDKDLVATNFSATKESENYGDWLKRVRSL